jgi:hypothetical protein
MKKGNQMYYGNAKTRNAFNIYRVWCENRGSGVGVDLTLASFLQGRMMRVREAYNQHGESQAQEVAIKSFNPEFKDDSAIKIMVEYFLEKL